MDSPARKIVIEIFGWYGMAAVISAYAMLSFGYLQPTDVLYQFFNATGSLGLILISLHKQAFQPAALNVIWIVVATLALLRMG